MRGDQSKRADYGRLAAKSKGGVVHPCQAVIGLSTQRAPGWRGGGTGCDLWRASHYCEWNL